MFRHHSLYVLMIVVIGALLVASLPINKTISTRRNEPKLSETTYEAPLIDSNDPQRIAGRFTVRLRKGHSFDEHIALIGTQKHVRWRQSDQEDPDERSNTYYGYDVGDALLASIRADPGVEEVVCDRLLSLEQLMERPVPDPKIPFKKERHILICD
jgi:hypothetical protein